MNKPSCSARLLILSLEGRLQERIEIEAGNETEAEENFGLTEDQDGRSKISRRKFIKPPPRVGCQTPGRVSLCN